MVVVLSRAEVVVVFTGAEVVIVFTGAEVVVVLSGAKVVVVFTVEHVRDLVVLPTPQFSEQYNHSLHEPNII